MTRNLNVDGPGSCLGFGGAHPNEGAHGAGAIVDFRLGQVEEVLAFDIPGTHVVADGVA